MKKIHYSALLTILLTILGSNIAYSQIYLEEYFENGGNAPTGWTEEYVTGTASWIYKDGGLYAGGENHPESAYEGDYNAAFIYSTSYTTKLVSPSIDLEDALKPALVFGHAMQKYGSDIDELYIYFRSGIDSAWMLLKEYTVEVPNWVERTIYLPDSLLTNDCYIAFEAVSKFGAGVCVDSVIVVEKGYIPKKVNSLNIKPVTTSFIPTNSLANEILQVNIEVIGNNGNVVLDSIAIKSLNTSDDDISTNGVKLYFTEDTVFSTSNEIGVSNFESGVAIFDNLNQTLPYDWSSIWVCYDIGKDSTHKMHNHTADAMIEANSIKINNYTYPFADKSPEGSRTIYESIFIDGFENDKGWVYTGEFERGAPQGLGAGGFYNPDPSEAHNGLNIIGTDLSGLGSLAGDYEANIGSRAYSASSPSFDANYFKDVTLVFYKMLNLDSYDSAYIELSANNGSSWKNIWKSSGYYNDKVWKESNMDVSNVIDGVENGKIRFTLGPTSASYQAGGWNIDDVVFVGDYISKDVGVTSWLAPLNGCGHTSEEYVEITITNFAGDTLKDPLPISFSFNGGTTIYRDTIEVTNIAPGNSINHTISDKPVDLSSPGWYNNVYARTNLPGDEVSSNDRLNKVLFISPTYTIPYSQNFENNYGYYIGGGTNSTWEYGTPAGTVINSAASGTKAWVTNLDGLYLENESSYLESPCFNFAGSDSIIFEFKCKGLSEDKTDGLAVMYSFDQGQNWSLVPNDHDYYWEWYNESNISELGSAGIDSTNNVWKTMRQLLPDTFSNQSSVKFRFILKSDETATLEGFGIDDIKVYEAPYDIGVSSLAYPYTQCEWNDTTHVITYIENYGPIDVKSGTKIPLVLKVNTTTIHDTLTLTSDLVTEDSVLFVFNSTIDMSYTGDYDFTIYTKLESDSYFYNQTQSNDSLETTVSVTGMPRYNPFPDQIGDNPIDTLLAAGTGYASYNWSGGGNSDVTPPQDTLYVDTEGWYKVTVTNGAGCSAIDSVEVVNSEIDLVMDSLYTELEDSCHRNELTELAVHYINKGLNPLAVNDTILLGYQINNNPVVEDTMFIAVEVPVDDTAWFTYNVKADLRTPGPYTIKVFTNILKDLDHANDTITKTVNTNGYVDIELNYDTVYSSQADTLEIIATTGYSTYSWDPAETNDTINPVNNESQWYKVTVTDSYACDQDIDSAYVETYDFGINNVVAPVSDCEFTTNESIQISVHNYSGNNYTTGTKIPFKYDFNSAGWINDTVTLASDFNAGANQTLTLTNTINPSSLGEHTLDIMVNAVQDADATNDTYNHTFETWGYPDVELAYDTIYTTRADTVLLIAQDGFNTYNWSDGVTTNDTLAVSDQYSENYIVTVTDSHGCGNDKDSTQIITYNLGVMSLLTPESKCENTASETVRITVKNYGKDVFPAGTSIPLRMIFNNNPVVNETLVLSSDLNAGAAITYEFTEKVNLSSKGSYSFKLYTDFNLDVKRSNDTLVDVIKTFGYPTLELGDDIYTAEPDTVTITAPAGYHDYIWDDGSHLNTLSVTYPASKQYSLTVSDINGCAASDGINIYTYNIIADSLASPIDQCELTNSETVIIGVTNQSEDTLQTGEPLEVGYRLNSGSYVYESFTLTETLYPDSTSLFTMSSNTADLSENQLHEFKIFAKLTNIDVETSDTTTKTVDFLKPIYDLGADVNTGNAQYTINAGSGYTSYEWSDESANQTYVVDINNQNPNHYYAVTVTNSDGCEASDSIQVTFTTQPDLELTQLYSPESECWQETKDYQVQVQITNSGVVNLTPGTSFTVGYLIDNGTAVTETYNLSTAMNASDTRDHTFTQEINFASAKVYEFKPFVYLTDDGNRNNDTLEVDVDISAPTVSLGPNDTVYFTTSYEISTTENYQSYEWSDGSTGPTLTVNASGTYSVTVTDALGCQGSGSIVCIKYTGIDNVIAGKGYSLKYYPNPTSDVLNIEFENKINIDATIEIININGNIIYNSKLTNIKNNLEKINVGSHANGIYYLRIMINGNYYTRKLIIQ